MNHIYPDIPITFGKYAGETGRRLARSAEGSAYLRWAENQQGITIHQENPIPQNLFLIGAKSHEKFHGVRQND